MGYLLAGVHAWGSSSETHGILCFLKALQNPIWNDMLFKVQFDLSYPASLYPDLSIIRTRSRRDFFLCVYNNYGEKGDFKLNQNSYTNSHELHIIPNIINIHSHQIFF